MRSLWTLHEIAIGSLLADKSSQREIMCFTLTYPTAAVNLSKTLSTAADTISTSASKTNLPSR